MRKRRGTQSWDRLRRFLRDWTADRVGQGRRGSSASRASRAVRQLWEALRTGDHSGLDSVVEVLRRALAASPVHHPDRAEWLNALGAALQLRFEGSGSCDDIEEAVRAGRAAVEATPVDDPDRAMYLTNLGSALQIRFDRTGDPSDLDEIIDAGRVAAANEAASPRIRAEGARGWGHSAGSAGRGGPRPPRASRSRSACWAGWYRGASPARTRSTCWRR